MRPWSAASRRAIDSARFSSGWEIAAHEREDALMPLNIETFNNAVGGNAFYKAITHPLAAEPARALVAKLKASGPVAIFDPHNLLAAFDALFPLDRTEIAGVFVQDVSHIGRNFRGGNTQPVTELSQSRAGTVLIAAFDAAAATPHLRTLGNRVYRLSFD